MTDLIRRKQSGEAWETATGGAGELTTDRARYNAASSVSSGNLVEWVPTPDFQVGRDLLDFTDPQAPTFLIAGHFAGYCWAQDTTGHAGKFMRLDFEFGNTILWETSIALDLIGSQFPTLTVGGVFPVAVGEQLFCEVDHDAGGAIGTFRLMVALLAEIE